MESPNKTSSPLSNNSPSQHQSPSSPSKKRPSNSKNSRKSIRDDLDESTYNADQEAEQEDLLREDKNSRTVLHRAALDHDPRIVRQLCQRATKIMDITEYVNKKDKFGNSALLGACVYNQVNRETDEKQQCVKILLEYGADPNQYNHHNLWTPLTWCAYYGDHIATRLLVEKGAYVFWPDKEGHFPLDHCGLQDDRGNKRKAAIILIDKLFELLCDYENKKLQKEYLEITFGKNWKFLQSPLLRTSLLYWVTYFNISEYFSRLLELDGTYPDMPIKTIFGRNCYHASCMSGNKEALNILLDNKRRYYSMHQRFIRPKMYDIVTGAYKGSSEKEEYERAFAFSHDDKNKKKMNLLYSKRFVLDVKETVTWIFAFDHQIDRMIKEENNGAEVKAPNYFEVKDFFGNTPLHFASFLGKTEIVNLLLENGANIAIENKDGWRCAELKQHKEIEQLYKEHMKKIFLESVKHGDVTASSHHRDLKSPKTKPKSNKIAAVQDQKSLMAATGSAGGAPNNNEEQDTIEKKFKMFSKERKIPDVVLIFRTKINDDKDTTIFIQNRVNFNISLLNNKFDCYLSKDINDSVCYLMIKTNERDLDYQCLKYNMKMKLLNAYGYKLYDPLKKADFEPFRSRQRAEITLTAINDVLNVQQLKDLKILQEVYPMHTVSGIERVREIWLDSKWYWPQPLASFRDYLREGKHLNFTAITTLRLYFGESVAFYFAWCSFYTCYLLVLAIPGLLVMIFILRDTSTSAYLLPAWVIYNSLCSTLVVEKWKRKAAEIATRWGTLELLEHKTDQKVLRSEFIGNEIINQTTGALTKDNTKSKTSFYFVLSSPILILLMAAVVATFLGTQQLIAEQPGTIMSMVISTLNGVIIAVLNFVYQKLARYFVDKENHKYTYTYEKSLIFKSFLSLFFNSYLGILYLIFIKNVELEKVYFNLISILITKQATSIATTAVIPWVLYKLKQKKYFESVNTKGKEQARHRDVKGDTNLMDHDVANSKYPLIQEPSKSKKGKQPENDFVVKRPVLNCKKGAAEVDKWDLMRVELNGMKSRNDDFNDDYGQMLIQYGYITMFASAFPVGPIISFIANILDCRAKIFSFLYVYHRPPIEKAAGIGNWQNVWEIMSVIGLFTNALILFFRSSTSFDWFEDVLMDDIPNKTIYNDVRRLWTFLIVVYIILVLKLLARAFIQDKPQWVMNEEEKQKNIDKNEIEADHVSTMQNLDRSYMNMKSIRDEPRGHQKNQHSVQKSNNNILSDDMLKTPKEKQPRQDQQGSAKKFFQPSPTKSILQSEEVRETKPQEMEVKFVEHSSPTRALPLVPLSNLSQGVKSLFFNAFNFIEKELSFRRLECFSQQVDELVIICQGCRKARALLECIDCQEKHCHQCMKNVHDQTTRKTHKIAHLVKANDNSFDHQSLSVSAQKNKETSQHWVKLQNFEFPTYVHGDSYINLERVYNILQKIYITENGVSEDNTITDIKTALKFKQKSLETVITIGKKIFEQPQQPGQEDQSSAGKSPMKKELDVLAPAEIGEIDHAWFDTTKKFFGLSSFNLEEKILINRVAFLTFKKRGAKATYQDFGKHMKTLQEGNLEARLMLFFDLIDEDSDGLISQGQMVSFIDKSLLQDMNADESSENILRVVFENKKTANKKQLLNALLSNKKAKQLFMSYFQMKEDRTALQVDNL